MFRPFAAAAVAAAFAFPAPAAPPELPAEAVVLPGGGAGRTAAAVDPVAVALARPGWKAPRPGDTLPGVPRPWEAGVVKDGTVPAPPGGYAYVDVKSAGRRVTVMRAAGHTMVYVNGEPRAGDVYSTGYVTLPVLLRDGGNDFLFAGGRLAPKVTFRDPRADAELDADDATLPDLRVGVPTDVLAAIVVRNCTADASSGLTLEVQIAGGPAVVTPVPPLPAAGVRKVGFRIAGPAPAKAGPVPVSVKLRKAGRAEPLDSLTLTPAAASDGATHKRTFASDIDGSVQYYSVVPALPADGGRKPAMVLTLHGASVEGSGQAACFARKPGVYTVAPTNRRPYGFDWEDWGRLDAMEVLHRAEREFGTDPRRTYLTGHSMGGHGTWHVGVTFPGRFAAIGPSAGWVSKWSYGGLRKEETPSPERALVARVSGPSDTLALSRNLAPLGVYVLHGSADGTVRTTEARTMLKDLADFHRDYVYFEQQGAGHWWGNACVDWPPMAAFFAARERPAAADVKHIDFRTAAPRVSASCDWLRVETQVKPFALSRADVTLDAAEGVIRGTTENVARVSFDRGVLPPGKPLRVELDGQKAAAAGDESRAWFSRDAAGKWAAVPNPGPGPKGPHRAGPFKDAFRNKVLFVYGTAGTPAENARDAAKARFDAETFWYRGNGSIDVIPDTAFDAKAEPDRNVVLYGHAGGNTAWTKLLAGSPVTATAGAVTVGGKKLTGDGFGLLLVRPRPGSDTAVVAAVAGTGPAGGGVLDRLPYFSSGVGYPDWTAFDAAGVVGTGFFGNDWSLDAGETAWRAAVTPK